MKDEDIDRRITLMYPFKTYCDAEIFREFVIDPVALIMQCGV